MSHVLIDKHRHAVCIKLVTGDELVGNVFLSDRERLADLIHDRRAFLPFAGEDDQFYHIAKASIAFVQDLANGSPERDSEA